MTNSNQKNTPMIMTIDTAAFQENNGKRYRSSSSGEDSLNSNEEEGRQGQVTKKRRTGGSLASTRDDASADLEYYDKENDAVPFIQKLYAMINQCHSDYPHIACWSVEGNTFVVKDKDEFSKQISPLYFNHSNFSSLVRQLNFYGFSKMQTKEIRNGDANKKAVNYVSFHNKNFIRGREDLLKNVRRSTEGQSKGEQKKVIDGLKGKVAKLERENMEMKMNFARLEETIQILERNQQLLMVGQYCKSSLQNQLYNNSPMTTL